MSEPRTCPACGSRSADGMLCPACMRSTRKALRQIAEWWPVLQETIGRRDRLHGSAQSGAVFRPVPFEPAASALADEIHSDLVGWVRILTEELRGPWPERGDTPSLARHLENHVSTLRRHEAADSLPTIGDWPGRIKRAVDYPDERGRIKVGPCPEKIIGEACAGVVWARFFEAERPTMTCEPSAPGPQSCGTVWNAEQFERASNRILKRIEEQRLARERAAPYAPKTAPARAPLPFASIIPLVTIADASIIYGVPEGTIRRWLSEHRLWAFGSRSMRLVSAWQVADVAKRNRREPKGPAELTGPADPVAERTLRGVSW